MKVFSHRAGKGWTNMRLALMGSLVLMLGCSTNLWAADEQQAEMMVKNVCATCHKFQGDPESRFNLKAPDLMWGGSKYQHKWLVDFLMGKEKMLYVKSYRWDQGWEPDVHIKLPEDQAEAIAAYLEKHYIDPRVKVGAFDLTKVTKKDFQDGAFIYKEHACIGCHTIEENGQLVGGPQSVDLSESGRRYNQDWLFRFGINPQDFTPHSGEFLADATEPQLRSVIGYLMTLGVPDFKFYEPWKSPEFQMASVDRGKVIYKEYCSQCHGATGKGDGPGASGLSPKPAIHANMAFDKLPMEYLYNVIYHGGRSVGKSTSMPYWSLTIHQQGVADVIAYLKVTFKGSPEMAAATTGEGPSGVCPQPRKTKNAPGNIRNMTNPLPADSTNIKAGETLFQQTAQPLACMNCHGVKGDGKGPMGGALNPHPRNFTCGETMKDISDGQMFWIIKNGSKGTGMMAFPMMPDNQIWQLIHYIRTLAK
ncbi:c-type cytochrome [Candidatus Nitronereus thalassa]|uniref:C-type cytochrome n=1 Tax=Candidatus Nitronereus thalassa TaxID=3020898 RepID=A0ABU3K7M5_9BACT|nr:c-type cytochrome [Candidatus Nitronereus thalassa]MDT7042378.1 c-type cytochrome [Candidatus Nitronereus thalassa]